jgi:Secretion system C-terminal sorting domain
MTKRLFLTSLLLLIFTGMLFAQSADTVYVPANNPDGTPWYDSIIDHVVADTNSSGEQLHSVYKLERGQFYLLNKAITFRNPVEIVADPPVPNDPTKTPPKIMSNINEEGGTSTGSLFITFADITLKNLWLSGIDLGGVNHGWGDRGALLVNDSLVTVNIDGLWCDWNSWSAFGTDQPGTKWYINNMHARNEQNEGDQWTTFLFWFENAGTIDTFVVTNTSYFQSNSFFIFPPSVVKYISINHCTFANSYKWPFHQTQWLNARFTNNIFFNSGALGLTVAQSESQDPDGLMYGLINVDTLAANQLGGDTLVSPYTIPESERIVEVKNNLWYYSSDVEAYLAAHDTLLRPVWMNERTQAMFDNDAVWPGLVAENNWNQDPMFNDFTDLSVATGKLAQAITDIQAGNTHAWDWDGDQISDPDFYKILIQYPTAENFRSYSGLVGTDGNPLGDLSFYPPELVGVEAIGEEIPSSFVLNQNYPNPFNPTTTVEFSIPEAGEYKLDVFNILGQSVAQLVNKNLQAGNYKSTLDASNLSSGLYFYKLSGKNVNITRKMMLLK